MEGFSSPYSPYYARFLSFNAYGYSGKPSE